MSSRQLEEQMERDEDEAVADHLGITVDELGELDHSLEPHESDDGLLYGYNVYFGDNANPEILAKVLHATDQRWVRIGLI